MRANVDFLNELGAISDDLRRIDYLPSPTEIAEACASIRGAWTRSEKRRRYVGAEMPDDMQAGWQPPVIDTTQFRFASVGHVESTI